MSNEKLPFPECLEGDDDIVLPAGVFLGNQGDHPEKWRVFTLEVEDDETKELERFEALVCEWHLLNNRLYCISLKRCHDNGCEFLAYAVDSVQSVANDALAAQGPDGYTYAVYTNNDGSIEHGFHGGVAIRVSLIDWKASEGLNGARYKMINGGPFSPKPERMSGIIYTNAKQATLGEEFAANGFT